MKLATAQCPPNSQFNACLKWYQLNSCSWPHPVLIVHSSTIISVHAGIHDTAFLFFKSKDMCSLALIHVFFAPYRDNDSTLRSHLLSPLFVCACVYWWQWQVVFCIDCDTSLAVTAAAEYLRSGPSGSSKTCLQSSGSPWWGTAVWSKLLRLDTSCSLLWAFCHVLLSFPRF